MFIVALFLGIYSFFIFALGLLNFLYKPVIIIVSITILGLIIFLIIIPARKTIKLQSFLRFLQKQGRLFRFLFFLLFLQSIVNLLGALGPELGFDALWYHLTLPKLYLLQHSIFYIPGGLFYYSAMPKLAEMLYVAGLSFGTEVIPKLMQFSFGLLICFALYKLERKFFNPLISLLGVVIFYSNLVVAWESITAYIDLVRTFFELLAMWSFVSWWENQKRKWLLLSAAMLGFAITTKVLAIGSLSIFVVLLLYKLISRKTKFSVFFTTFISFCLTVMIIPLPWFLFAYFSTGNPFYPFFTGTYEVIPEKVNIINFFKEIWSLFIHAADPISPIYLIFLPLIILFFQRFPRLLKLITFYSLLAVVVWYFTPRTGGGRFILPYLPAFSILCAGVLAQLVKHKKLEFISKFLVGVIIVVSLLNLTYRFVANKKYIPVIFGYETKQQFLTNNLNFAFGDFYDTDNYFKTHIKPTDSVLVYGFHNLYYVDFPFIDVLAAEKGKPYNFIMTQKADLSSQYKNWKLIYTNDKTMVKLYSRK